jgi:hypothetical protein
MSDSEKNETKSELNNTEVENLIGVPKTKDDDKDDNSGRPKHFPAAVMNQLKNNAR